MSQQLDRNGSSIPRAVFFDLAGTLVEVRGGIGARYAAIALEYGVEAEPAAIDSAFPAAFAAAGRMVFVHPDAAEVASLEKGFWKNVVRLMFARIGLLDRFEGGAFDRYFEQLFDYFATGDGWHVFPDVVPVLEQLERRGLIVGLITNFDCRVFRLVDALDLSRLIESVTIPALAGAAKPDAAIFRYALARHGVRPEEAVQVGDSMGDDVEGARAAGLRAVLIDRKGRFQGNAGVTRIASLEDLPRVLHLAG